MFAWTAPLSYVHAEPFSPAGLAKFCTYSQGFGLKCMALRAPVTGLCSMKRFIVFSGNILFFVCESFSVKELRRADSSFSFSLKLRCEVVEVEPIVPQRVEGGLGLQQLSGREILLSCMTSQCSQS